MVAMAETLEAQHCALGNRGIESGREQTPGSWPLKIALCLKKAQGMGGEGLDVATDLRSAKWDSSLGRRLAFPLGMLGRVSMVMLVRIVSLV